MIEQRTYDGLKDVQGISKILWVEDVHDDVVFGSRELKKAGFKFATKRVETSEEFREALQSFQPDIILSDHGLPQFNSAEAFRIYRENQLTIPFILVTGMVSEEFAVSSLKLGIDDYVLKTNLSLLPAAILNSLNNRLRELNRRAKEEESLKHTQKLEEDIQLRTQEAINEKTFTDSIVNNLPGLFFVMGNNRFVRWNKNLENISGYSAVEIGKLNLLDLVSEKDKIFAKEKIQATTQEGVSRFELPIATKSGALIPHYFTGLLAPIANAELFVGMGVDISDLQHAQEMLRLHEERMELAFSTSGNSWWDWNIVSGNVDSHTNRFLTLGYSKLEMRPREEWWTSLIHPDDLAKSLKALEDCLSGRQPLYDCQCRMASKNGDWKWFHLLGKVVARDSEGRPVRMIGTSDNITRNKQIEQELIEARFTAESATRTKSQFLANMSHEIRTPLNAVIGLSHLARKTDLNPKQQDYLKKIHSSSESLLSIINDILDFSKVEAGKLTLEEVPFDLEEVLQKLSDVISYKAYGKGLEIAFGIDADVFTHLIGDPVRLEQILSNLCSNAVKFTDAGEVVVTTKLLEESGDSIKIQFEVTDSGIGMEQVQLARLFAPFSQADDSISRRFGGTGLGLSIIKHLVELMNGKVWVTSQPGRGSSFYFTASFKKQKSQCKLPVPSVDMRKLRVLLVDDNNSSLKILRNALESFSMEVTTARSGMEAIPLLKASFATNPMQLLLIDWKMPEMDGLETAKLIRNDAQFQKIPIVMMCTSYANDELYQSVDRMNLSGVLIKPIRYSTLYDTLISALDRGTIRKKKETNGHDKVASDKRANLGHILLVEDNEINQQVAGELLVDFGYTYEIAVNGLEAVRKVRESGVPSRYSAVLMDLQMPVMGGFKATVEIRMMEAYQTLPIIAMTADAMGGVREKCLEVGMMDYITKPVNPTQIQEVLMTWVAPTESKVIPPTKKVTEVVELPVMDGIDLEEALLHVRGNAVLLRDLFIKFRDAYQHFITNVKKEFANGDESSGRRSMHSMKGLSASLGMRKLHEETVKAEKSLILGGADGNIGEILSATEFELQRVLISLRTIPAKSAGLATMIPLSTVKPLLQELNRLLKAHDLEAVAVLKKVGQVKGFETQIKQIETAVQTYDFDKAAKILDEIENETTAP